MNRGDQQPADRPVPPDAASSWQEASAKVDAMVAKAREHAEQVTAMTEELEEVQVTDGFNGVEVTLGHTGALIRVRIIDESLYVPAIEEAIVIANQRAQQQLREVVEDLVAEHCGPTSATAQHFAEQYARLFPEPAVPAEPDRTAVLR